MSGKTLAGGVIDVAIIGAGAAGVGAARRLQSLRTDLSLLLLEASDRIGGRARTVNPHELGPVRGLNIDTGQGSLQSARLPSIRNRYPRLVRKHADDADGRAGQPWRHSQRQWRPCIREGGEADRSWLLNL